MKPLSALVIDDSASDRELLRRSLTGAGYSVAEASDGRSGMVTLLEAAPDVVVVDWALTGMAGIDVVRRIRAVQTPKYPYIVAVAERAGGIDIAAAYGAGIDDFTRKPVSREELVARVDGVKRLHSLVDRLAAQSSVYDWSGGFDLARLRAWTGMEALIATALAGTFGRSPRTVERVGSFDGAMFAAEVPLSLASENLELRIAVAFDEQSLQRLATVLMGSEVPPAGLRDVAREIANLAAGAFKRMAQTEGVVLTAGLPIDIAPRALAGANPRATRSWRAVLDDPAISIAFQAEVHDRPKAEVAIGDLHEGMVLVHDLLSPTGALLVPSGTRLTSSSIGRVRQLLGERRHVEVMGCLT
jgi:CheY-like chemotaxis protein